MHDLSTHCTVCTTLGVHRPKSIRLLSPCKENMPLTGLVGGGENVYKIQYLVECLITQLFFLEYSMSLSPNQIFLPRWKRTPDSALQSRPLRQQHTARWRRQWLKFSFNNIQDDNFPQKSKFYS